MTFGIALSCIATLFLAAAVRFPIASPWLIWVSVSLVLVAVGYFGPGAKIVGKRADGTLPWWRGVLLFPYLAYTWTFWWLYCVLSREAVFNEVSPGIWLGRRPRPEELPDGMRVVVDLTAEFPASTAIVASGMYRSLPALDGSVPDQSAYLALVGELAVLEGPMYIHCAFGHGRSAAVAAGVLVARGLAADCADAERRLRAARPRVHLLRAQRRLVEQVPVPVRM